MKRILFFFIFVIIFGTVVYGEDYSFDVSEFEKKPFEIGYELRLNPVISTLNEDAVFYSMMNKTGDTDAQTEIRFEIDSSFKKSKNSLFLIGAVNRLIQAGESDDHSDIYQLYYERNFTDNLSLSIGKKTAKWGKGYVFNPVSFAGRQKDVNDIDASMEGFFLVSGQYIKSLKGPLSNYSIELIIIPENRDEDELKQFNTDYYTTADWNYMARLYMLYRDIDLDLYILHNRLNQNGYGSDFALNITTNFEVHGEIAYRENLELLKINPETGEYYKDLVNTESYITGVRYLTVEGTTFILEYLHNGSGLSRGRTTLFFEQVLESNNLKNPAMISPQIFFKERINKQFAMQNYLYLKASHPEPFNILYFMPGIFSIYNLDDNSFQTSLELAYSRFNDFQISLKYTSLFGDPATEFGEKLNTSKLEARLYFIF